MTNIVFYFTGTGNGYWIAKRLGEKLGNAKVETILNLREYTNTEINLMGIVIPVYYLHAPKVVINLLKQFDFKNVEKLFVLGNYGGTYGYVFEDIRDVVTEKVELVGEYKTKMPGNYILEYGALPVGYQNYLIKKANEKIIGIVDKIKTVESFKELKPNLVARIYKNSASNKINKFKDIGKEFFTKDSCIKCKQCVNICPVNNIELGENNIIWNDKCEQCMACVQWCPKEAINHPMINGRKRNRYTNKYTLVKDILKTNKI